MSGIGSVELYIRHRLTLYCESFRESSKPVQGNVHRVAGHLLLFSAVFLLRVTVSSELVSSRGGLVVSKSIQLTGSTENCRVKHKA